MIGTIEDRRTRRDAPNTRWIGTLALLGALALFPPAPARALSEAQIKKLEAGGVLVSVNPDKSGAALIDAAIDIPVPRRALWTAMLDCERMKRVITGLKSCRVVERDPKGAWDVREHVIDFAWFLPNVRSVFRSELEEDTRIVFRRVSGDLTVLEGEWRLEPLAGGKATRLWYKNKVGMSLPVPKSMIRDSLLEDTPIMLRELRAEVARPGGGD